MCELSSEFEEIEVGEDWQDKNMGKKMHPEGSQLQPNQEPIVE